MGEGFLIKAKAVYAKEIEKYKEAIVELGIEKGKEEKIKANPDLEKQEAGEEISL